MEEIALTNAYVYEDADGTLKTFNCRVKHHGSKLVIETTEALTKGIHVNVKNSYSVKVKGSLKGDFNVKPGMQWLGEAPRELQVYKPIK